MKYDRNSIFSSFSTIIVFIIFVIIGLVVLPLIPLQLNPNTSMPSISINTTNPKIGITKIEEQVISVIEGAVSTIDGINSIHSQSSANSGSVQINFDKYVDINAKRIEILAILRRIYPSFPINTAFPSVEVRSATEKHHEESILQYNIVSKRDQEETATILEQFVVRELTNVDEIKDIQLTGYSANIYEIEYDYEKMASLGVTISQLTSVLQELNRRILIGSEKSDVVTKKQKAIIIEKIFSNPLELSNLEVSVFKNKKVLISDFANVRKKSETPQMYYRVNGKHTLGLSIIPKENINQIQLVEKIKTKVEELKNTIPNDIEIVLINDGTELINKEKNKLLFCSFITLLILFVFVLAISRDIRYVIIIFIAFAATLSIAFFFYYLFKIELHLFSFAGLTISLGMLLDDSIMMLEHLKRNKNKNVIRSIIASSLATVAALSAVFFLDDETRLRLNHFALVVIINLGLSSVTSLFLVPALTDIIKPKTRFNNKLSITRLRFVHSLSKLYKLIIYRILSFKWVLFVAIILGFGLPLFLLPEKINTNDFWGNLYNKTLGSNTYQFQLKPTIDPILGGALYPFVSKVKHSEYNEERKEKEVNIQATFPKGTTIKQVNDVFIKLEDFLSHYTEIKIFYTYIDSPERGVIQIKFKDEYTNSSFPANLVQLLSRYVIQLGSAEWDVSGAGEGFSNKLREGTSNSKIYLYGFSIEELREYSTYVKRLLEKNMRVDKVHISSKDNAFHNDNFEYTISLKKEKLTKNSVSVTEFIPRIQSATINHQKVATLTENNTQTDVYISSTKSNIFDTWMMKNKMYKTAESAQKMKNYGNIEKETESDEIYKTNQQYQLILDFDYIGNEQDGYEYAQYIVENLKQNKSMGLTASLTPKQNLLSDENSQPQSKAWILIYAVVCIYLICAILFESLIQPLFILIMIPLAFTGIFLAFYIFEIQFDQGGYASFFLLTGLTVNAAIYLVTERNFMINNELKKLKTLNECYFRAFDKKIVPIFFTIISTSLGLIPFLLMGKNESFWFSLALGTISGLLFSIIGLLLFLPLFFIKKQKNDIIIKNYENNN